MIFIDNLSYIINVNILNIPGSGMINCKDKGNQRVNISGFAALYYCRSLTYQNA